MPTPIDRERVHALIGGGAKLVEALPWAEFEDEHLPGAISIPLRQSSLSRRGEGSMLL